jgi:hypothetical protein
MMQQIMMLVYNKVGARVLAPPARGICKKSIHRDKKNQYTSYKLNNNDTLF